MKKQFSRSRRGFFKKLGLLGGAAALTGVIGRRFGIRENEPQATADSGKRYRVTPHIKKYYRTADS
jgi:hypothetical protein